MSTPNAVCLGMGQQAQALKCFVRVVFWVAAPLPVCLAMYFPEKRDYLTWYQELCWNVTMYVQVLLTTGTIVPN